MHTPADGALDRGADVEVWSPASDEPLSAAGGEPRARAANGRFIRTPSEPATTQLPADRFLDRELSWLQFNERVLQLAADPDIPLLERARFLAIFGSNLDEFFMVRVAGLMRRIATGIAVPSASGLEPRVILEQIESAARALQSRHSVIFHDHVRPALADHGIVIIGWDDLAPAEHEAMTDLYTRFVYPLLTPLAVDPAHPFPYISGLSLNLAVLLVNPKSGKQHFARVKIPPSLPRFIEVQDSDSTSVRMLPLEKLIAAHLGSLFPGMDVVDTSTFRVTRNEDLEVEEDDAENLLKALERELSRRKFGNAVRLEVEEDTEPRVFELLVQELGVDEATVYRLPAPLDLRGLNVIADVERSDLHYPPFVPRSNAALAPAESSTPADIFDTMRKQDVLLQHPYDSFSTSVQTFLEQAAADPRVLAIKQTLYRTSGDSPIINALIDAAEAGKQVLAIVEIKARFDEENNITWARKLEHAGVHVVYGVVGLKTHCKLALVVRDEEDGLRRYCHIGTGNYNPKTARLYEDFGLLTADPAVGEDLTRLFNVLSGLAPKARFERLLVAPRSIRSGLLERIEREVRIHKEGGTGQIAFKVNSIVDEQTIDALYRASAEGVQVRLWVRGICALRPGVPGLSENIQVRSILGRFLEHSRIFWFGNDGAPEVLIGSADLMHRNLDRRVEALVSIRDPQHVADLTWFLNTGLDGAFAHWELGGDGRWARRHRDEHGQALPDLQSALIARHARRRRKASRR